MMKLIWPVLLISTLIESAASAKIYEAVKLVSADSLTCVLSKDGEIKCWGRGDTGALGTGDSMDRGYNPSTMGSNLPAVNLGAGIKAIDLCTSGIHTCAITQNHRVKCWGSNFGGQIGPSNHTFVGIHPEEMGDNLPYLDFGNNFNAHSISCTNNVTCVLNQEGLAKCIGDNADGELGSGFSTERRIGRSPLEMGDNIIPVTMNSQRIIELKGTCALLADRTIRCWGDNSEGQTGTEDSKYVHTSPAPRVMLEPEGVTYAVDTWATYGGNSCAAYHLLKSSQPAKLKCWGTAHWYSGAPSLVLRSTNAKGTMGENLPAIDLGFPISDVTQLSVSIFFACALNRHGLVKCWGINQAGSLGLEDNESRWLATPEKMGVNLPYVNLGLPVLSLSNGVARTSRQYSLAHTCAILINHQVKCWGLNTFGQLGSEDARSVIGDGASQMGDELPYLRLQ